MTSGRSISEVLQELQAEFPDLTLSKLRFLESQQLVTPHRTTSGYRTYRERDLAQLRYVLVQQRDRFLPLRVIKENLASGDFATSMPSQETASTDLPKVPLNRRELLEHTGLSSTHLRELESFGIVIGVREQSETRYGARAIAIARLAAEFFSYGVEPRHLRPFAQSARREVDLYEQAVVSVHSTEGKERVRELRALGDELHRALVDLALDE